MSINSFPPNLHSIMLYLMILLVPILFANANHEAQNLSDVIITYSNHADAESETKPKPNILKKPLKIMVPQSFITEKTDTQVFIRERPEKERETEERVSDEVVFIPNEKSERELIRNEDYLMQHPLKISDYFGKKTVNDVINSNVMLATEPPSDIIFLSGRNDPNENIKGKKQPFDATTTEKPALNCTNLDCNNTVNSVCGGKMEHKLWRYRLFLNDCYFRKVNCHFTHEENRFHLLPLERCSSIGFHVATQPSPFQLFPMDFMFKNQQRERPRPVNNTRRVSGRRSLFKGLAGQACDHPCPPTCPDDYAPECAVSSTGQRRVFVNHCKLDWNSCTFHIAWYKRPLSECVGGKKADMRQNRGFIDWMQRVGIVDNKGRLVIS